MSEVFFVSEFAEFFFLDSVQFTDLKDLSGQFFFENFWRNFLTNAHDFKYFWTELCCLHVE